MEPISVSDVLDASPDENLLRRSKTLMRANRYGDVVALLEPKRHQSGGTPASELTEELEVLGGAHYRLQRYREASDAIEKAGLIRPVSSSSQIRLASCYARLGRTDLARELFLQATLAKPLSEILVLEVSRGLREVKAAHLASLVCERAIRSSPEPGNAPLLFELAICLSQICEPRYRIEALVQQAARLMPQELHFQAALATILFGAGEIQQALAIVNAIAPDQIHRVGCHICCNRVGRSLRKQDDEVGASRWLAAGERLSDTLTPANALPCLDGGLCDE